MVSERKIKTYKKMWIKITMELQAKSYGVDVGYPINISKNFLFSFTSAYI